MSNPLASINAAMEAVPVGPSIITSPRRVRRRSRKKKNATTVKAPHDPAMSALEVLCDAIDRSAERVTFLNADAERRTDIIIELREILDEYNQARNILGRKGRRPA